MAAKRRKKPKGLLFMGLLSLFAANQWKCLSLNPLHAAMSFPGQAQSSLIKPFYHAPITTHFRGSATVSVAPVGVPLTASGLCEIFTRST